MGELADEMKKFVDLFWYYVGAFGMFAVLLSGLAELGTQRGSLLSDLPFAAAILMTGLCMYYRPAAPKRVALFGLLTLLGSGLIGSLTGTEDAHALIPLLTTWMVGMLFAFLVVRFQLDRKLRAAIPHRS
ncbi:hypothetical protein [Haladaptatus sp.]|uniref:hypothetical protein n=1 Tax=Haladaptatus sp. TaxID=1973141 RepID=UPI003C6098CA